MTFKCVDFGAFRQLSRALANDRLYIREEEGYPEISHPFRANPTNGSAGSRRIQTPPNLFYGLATASILSVGVHDELY